MSSYAQGEELLKQFVECMSLDYRRNMHQIEWLLELLDLRDRVNGHLKEMGYEEVV